MRAQTQTLILLLTIMGLMVGALTAVGEAQDEAARSKLESLVAGALKGADHLFARAEKLGEKANKQPKGSAKWFRLSNEVKRAYWVGHNSLRRFRKVKLSSDLKAAYNRTLAESSKRLVTLYNVLIEEYAKAGSRSTVVRLLSELKKVDLKAYKALKPKSLVRRMKKGSGIGTVDVGPTIHPRSRAGRRLTGEEARWLGRRGYPIGPPPRGGASGGSTAPRTPAPAPRTGSGGVGGRR